MWTEITTERFIWGAALAGGGLLLAWLAAALVILVEDRLARTVRPSAGAWRRAPRHPLFWLVLTLTAFVIVNPLLALEEQRERLERGTIAVSVVFGVLIAIGVSNRMLEWYARGGMRVRPLFGNTALPIIQRFTTIALVTIGVVYVLDTFGQPITPLIAVLSVGGFGIALAFRDTLANFFASTTLATDGGIRVGDSIEIEGSTWGPVMGTVTAIGWRSTRLLTRANNIVVVPNQKLAENYVTNYSSPVRDMGVIVRGGVGYSNDLRHVEEVIMDLVQHIQAEHPTARTAQPSVWFERFGESNVEFGVYLRARAYDDSFLLISDFIKAVHERFREEGIEISLPVRNVYIREQDGQATGKERNGHAGPSSAQPPVRPASS